MKWWLLALFGGVLGWDTVVLAYGSVHGWFKGFLVGDLFLITAVLLILASQYRR